MKQTEAVHEHTSRAQYVGPKRGNKINISAEWTGSLVIVAARYRWGNKWKIFAWARDIQSAVMLEGKASKKKKKKGKTNRLYQSSARDFPVADLSTFHFPRFNA